MRLLFTSIPSTGHLHPLVPLAIAARAAGHEVAFACAESMRSAVEELGFRTFAAGLNRDGDGDPEFDALKVRARRLTPGPEMDQLAIADVIYGVRARRMLPGLLEICRQWRPDVVVRENFEAAGAVAAERLGIPHASVDIMPLFDTGPMQSAVQEQIDRLRAEAGLDPDPGLHMLHRYLHLCFAPPSLLNPAIPKPATLRTLRPTFYDQVGSEALPDWVARMPAQPTAYVTVGTVANRWRTDVFPGMVRTILEGLRDEPINVVVTVGRDADPAELGPQPANVHIERFIPHNLLLPHCDLAITHGGFGTVMGSIDAGLLQVLVPLLVDDPHNARRCAELGLARMIRPEDLTADRTREAVRDVLRDPAYRANLQRIRAEIRAQPGPDLAVGLLECLAVDRESPVRPAARPCAGV